MATYIHNSCCMAKHLSRSQSCCQWRLYSRVGRQDSHDTWSSLPALFDDFKRLELEITIIYISFCAVCTVFPLMRCRSLQYAITATDKSRFVVNQSLIADSNSCISAPCLWRLLRRWTARSTSGRIPTCTVIAVFMTAVEAAWTTSVPRRFSRQVGRTQSIVQCSTVPMWHDAVEDWIESRTHVVQNTCVAHVSSRSSSASASSIYYTLRKANNYEIKKIYIIR